MISISEQWNDVGDCSICRKRKYCSNPCKRNRIRQQREIAAVVTGAVVKALDRAERRASEE